MASTTRSLACDQWCPGEKATTAGLIDIVAICHASGSNESTCSCQGYYRMDSTGYECEHVFEGLLWPYLFNYLLIVPLLLTAVYVVLKVRAAKMSKFRELQNRRHVYETARCYVFANEAISTCNYLLCFVLLRLVLTTVSGTASMNQILNLDWDSFLAVSGSKFVWLSYILVVSAWKKAVTNSLSTRRSQSSCSVDVVRNVGALLLFVDWVIVSLACFHVLGQVFRLIFEDVFNMIVSFFLVACGIFFSSKVIVMINVQQTASLKAKSTEDVIRLKKYELVLVMSRYMRLLSINCLVFIGMAVVCQPGLTMELSLKSPELLFICHNSYRVIELVYVYCMLRMLEGTATSSFDLCCCNLRHVPATTKAWTAMESPHPTSFKEISLTTGSGLSTADES